MMLLKYAAIKPSFINTSEAYSKTIFVGNNNVAIPYISAGLMPHNPITNKQSVVDYSYYVFMDVHSMNFSAMKGKLTINFNAKIDSNSITEYIMAGGYKSDNGAEVKIVCRDFVFYLLDNARISDPSHPYLPLDTPNFRQNLDTNEVDAFFLFENLPKDIKEILGKNFYNLIWW